MAWLGFPPALWNLPFPCDCSSSPSVNAYMGTGSKPHHGIWEQSGSMAPGEHTTPHCSHSSTHRERGHPLGEEASCRTGQHWAESWDSPTDTGTGSPSPSPTNLKDRAAWTTWHKSEWCRISSAGKYRTPPLHRELWLPSLWFHKQQKSCLKTNVHPPTPLQELIPVCTSHPLHTGTAFPTPERLTRWGRTDLAGGKKSIFARWAEMPIWLTVPPQTLPWQGEMAPSAGTLGKATAGGAQGRAGWHSQAEPGASKTEHPAELCREQECPLTPDAQT